LNLRLRTNYEPESIHELSLWSKFKTINPATGETLAEYEMATPEKVKAAVERTKKAFENWRQLKPSERGKYLVKAAQVLKERKGEFARDMTNEVGTVFAPS